MNLDIESQSRDNAYQFLFKRCSLLYWTSRAKGIVLRKGATGFDVLVEAVAACRGSLVGLVKNLDKTTNADEQLALAA